MITLYQDVKDLYRAALDSVSEGCKTGQPGDGRSSEDLRRSACFLAGAAGTCVAAACFGRRKSASRALNTTSVLLAGAAVWNSRNAIGALARSARKVIGASRDQHWLRHHPINYA
jgi:hypothetical protein